MAESYGGVFGAIPYAFRESDSGFFRIYVVVGTFAALFVAVLTALALVVELGRTEGLTQGGLAAFSRSLFVLLGFAAVAPLLAPTLLVARRHRRDDRVHEFYDQALAVAGYGFLASLYLALIISAPAEFQEPTSSAFVRTLYALPRLTAIVPPILAVGGIVVADRKLRE
ncbi:hypothetical protein [Haloparvum sp. AD34]